MLPFEHHFEIAEFVSRADHADGLARAVNFAVHELPGVFFVVDAAEVFLAERFPSGTFAIHECPGLVGGRHAQRYEHQ